MPQPGNIGRNYGINPNAAVQPGLNTIKVMATLTSAFASGAALRDLRGLQRQVEDSSDGFTRQPRC